MADAASIDTERFLTFTLAGELFAIAITSVREILDMAEITRIPQMPPAMRGVVNVRGAAVPVIDLRLRFGLEAAERTVNTRIIIVEISTGDDTITLGAVADSVKEVLELDAANIAPVPAMGVAVNTAFLRGIGKCNGRFILLLDIGKVLHSDEIFMLDEVSRSLNDVSVIEGQAAAATTIPAQ
ncbi:chemotaxis protein CheW [Fundidesulfovibrio terrae]|uniref:chemotaxis protein CheW n=1 Tax=Fundidesulfovibrio terrae TaxID=2922866 RepID=UPI001FAE8F73|nr:chemotaxis protein CheW [Fundidesulfovibrio terrae]